MNLSKLVPIIQGLPEFKAIVRRLRSDRAGKIELNLPEHAYSYFIAAIYESIDAPLLFVVSNPELARRRYDQIMVWVNENDALYFLPPFEMLGKKAVSDYVVGAERNMVFSLLSGVEKSQTHTHNPPLIVTSASSLANRSISKEQFQLRSVLIRRGMQLSPSVLIERLYTLGYEFNQIVEIPGTFSRRGGIVDVFPSSSKSPFRIEFMGNQIESIRKFDPKTQRSVTQNGYVTLTPAKEISAAGDANIIDYLPDGAVVIFEDLATIEEEIKKIEIELGESKSLDVSANTTQANLCFSWEEISGQIKGLKHVIGLCSWNINDSHIPGGFSLMLKPAPNFAGRLNVFLNELDAFRLENERVVIVSQQSSRIQELVEAQGTCIRSVDMLKDILGKGDLVLLHGFVEGGWQVSNKLLLLTDLELFGFIKQRRSVKRRPVRHHWYLDDIDVGDYVVHVEHGIGKFAGIRKMTNEGAQREYLTLEYAGGDVLYVPIEQIDRVSPYIGGGRVPVLNRLGSQEWARTKQKVKESVINVAEELINLYAIREANSGFAYSSDTLWQQELEAAFPYVETPDQIDAMQAVKQDMESSKPMDRLLCGDVGYGKTEIALRAAFKALMDSKQVAILVPTTVLAQQHMNTFTERLSAFPIKIAMLSRFCSTNEQSEIIEKLANGSIDICIGTHRLLQKDVIFKDLGLVIIDEEQRFGVIHKEYLKKLRQTVDVLTLSATPIPRTLQMALGGVRDLSTIETPPESRLPIATYVGEFDAKVVREAVLREVERDGQVFIVHNRVQDIEFFAGKIADFIPEVHISIAHGQMEEEKLESVMADFLRGSSDVLVTTTIIESGLDLPNVNTLIVDNADKLGLTQLYQLRGRVGRGANMAYAYFLFDSNKKLTEQGRERLRTIEQATELGAGFAIAMKDLEIRGAGNLLGVEQSGYISAVGFNYYNQVLSEAVERIKNQHRGCKPVQKEIPAVSIDLNIPAYIPEDYIEDIRVKLNFYQRLVNLDAAEQLSEISEELTDRFGQIPVEVANLLYLVELKRLAKDAYVESISSRSNNIVLSFKDHKMLTNLDTSNLHNAITIGNMQIRIDLGLSGDTWKLLLKELLERLAQKQSSNNWRY